MAGRSSGMGAVWVGRALAVTGRGGWVVVSVLELVRVHGEDWTRDGLRMETHAMVIINSKSSVYSLKNHGCFIQYKTIVSGYSPKIA